MTAYILGAQSAVFEKCYSGPQNTQPVRDETEPNNVAYYGWAEAVLDLKERLEANDNELDKGHLRKLIMISSIIAYQEAVAAGLPVPLEVPEEFKKFSDETWLPLIPLFEERDPNRWN